MTHILPAIVAFASFLITVECVTTWRDAYNRGSPSIPSFCAVHGHKKQADGYCYPDCPPTHPIQYGTDTCYGPCWEGYTDSGDATCTSTGSYYRGQGKEKQPECETLYGVPCQQLSSMELWYQYCKPGYSTGLSFAEIENEFIERCYPIQTVQTKPTYVRTKILPICDPFERDSVDGLCYPYCLSGYTPEKNICWKSACPAGSAQCGVSLCLDSTITCAGSVELTQAQTVYHKVYSVSAGGTTNFIMEDIIRSQIGTSASIDNGLTFAAQDIALAGTRLCQERRFPKFLGTATGVTSINVIQLDDSGNIAFGGISTDITTVTISGNLIVGILQNTGFNFTWVTEIFGAQATQQVTQLEFSSDSSKLIALLTPLQTTIILFNAINGNTISKLFDSSSTLRSQTHSLMVNAQGWMFLASTTTSDRMMISGIDLLLSPGATQFVSMIENTNQLRAYSSVYLESSIVFVVAQNVALAATCLVGIHIQINSGSFSPFLDDVQCLPQTQTNYINHKMIGWSDSFGTEVLLMVAEPATTTQKGLLIVRRQVSPTIINEGLIYQENVADNLQVVEIQIVSSTIGYMVFKNLLRQKIQLMTISFVGGSNVEVTSKMIQKPLLDLSNLLAAKIQTNGEFYFAGTIQKLSSNDPSFVCIDVTPGSSAFISTSNNVKACQYSFFSTSTGKNFGLDGSLIFNPIAKTSTSATLNLISSSVKITVIPEYNLYLERNKCCDIPLSSSGAGYKKYVIDYPAETYSFPSFSHNLCLDDFPFWYKREYTSKPVAAPFDVPYIFFDDNPVNLKFTVQTSVLSTQGEYYIKVTGTLPNHQSASEMFSFIDLQINQALDQPSQCHLNKIAPSKDLPDQVIFAMQDPKAFPLILTFSVWTLSIPECGPIEYKSTLVNGQRLPRFISFIQIKRQFVIHQNQYMRPGDYLIRLQGKPRNSFMIEVAIINVTVTCQLKNLKPAYGDNVLRFKLIPGAPSIIFQVQDFIQSPNCYSQSRYELMSFDKQPADRAYGRYEEYLDSVLGTRNQRIILQAPFDSKIKIVQMKLFAFPENHKQPLGEQTILIDIQQSPSSSGSKSERNYPPIFKTLQAGNSWGLPLLQGSSNTIGLLQTSSLNVKITKKQIKQQSGKIQVDSIILEDSNQPSTFFDQDSGTLFLTIDANIEQGTRYQVKAEFDDGKNFKITQELFLVVYRRTDVMNLDQQEKFLLQSLIDRTKQEFSVLNNLDGSQDVTTFNENQQEPQNKSHSNPNCTDFELKARLVKFTTDGQATLRFNKPIMRLINYSNIDYTVLNISVEPAFQQFKQQRNLKIEEWNVTKMLDKDVQIKIRFSDPQDVSAYEIPDKLKIKVLLDFFFATPFNAGRKSCLDQDQLIWTKEIPKQAQQSDLTAKAATKSFGEAVFWSIPSNILIASLLSGSMMNIWGLINVLEILMLIPLMSVNLPSNVQIVFQTLQEVLSFEILTIDQIPYFKNIFVFRPSTEIPIVSDKFDQYGYEYPSLLQNIGSSIFWLILQFVVQIVLLIIVPIARKLFQLKWLQNLQKDIVFNMTLRILMEGQLQFMLCAIINMIWLDFSSTMSEKASSVISIAFLPFYILLLLGGFYVNRIIVKEKQDIEKFEKISTILEGCRSKDFHCMNYHMYQIIRNSLLVIVIVFLKNYQLAQVVSFSCVCLGFLLYSSSFLPLKDRKLQKIEIFNEIILILSGSSLYAFLETHSQKSQYIFGWYLVSLIILSIAVNTINAIFDSSVQIIQLVSKIYKNFKKNRAVKKYHCQQESNQRDQIEIQHLNIIDYEEKKENFFKDIIKFQSGKHSLFEKRPSTLSIQENYQQLNAIQSKTINHQNNQQNRQSQIDNLIDPEEQKINYNDNNQEIEISKEKIDSQLKLLKIKINQNKIKGRQNYDGNGIQLVNF